MSIGKEFLQTAVKRMKYYKDLADKAIAQLDDKELFYTPNEESNSIAVIIQHMAGNMLSRWTNFLEEDGEKEWRQRDAEFEAQSITRNELMNKWEEGWKCFINALEGLKKKDLCKTIYIRKEPLTVVDAINRQLAHYPYHVGQIIYIAKLLKNHEWENLSIPRGRSAIYNQSAEMKDPAKKY
jgi:hypothetical protein